MTVVNPPAKVLVTGASGFIAVNVVKDLLNRGFSVRGTVRSATKGEYLKNLFNAGDRFEYTIVPDIQHDGAFDEAVKGVDAVEHTASPVTSPQGDPDVVIKPAVEGTLAILNSVKNYGSSVKRIVITSSMSAAGHPPSIPAVVTEDLWNNKVVDAVKSQGANAPGISKYAASKTLAERAAWDFVEKHKDEITWDLVTLLPPLVFGPILQQVSSASDLNGSIKYLLHEFTSNKEGDALVERKGGWIDVRDVAKVHSLVLTAPDAGGERFFVTAGGFSVQDLYDGLNEEPAVAGAPVGQPGATKGKKWDLVFSTEKLQRVLGQSEAELFRPLAQTMKETVESLQKQGLWSFK